MSTTYYNAMPEQTLRARCKVIWESGDFGLVAKYNELVAEEFVSRLPVNAGDKVLDVACGTGNLAIPAARRGAETTGLDIAANLVEQARARAQREGLNARFVEGEAESLPFAEGSFDLVMSMFGVMFAPRPDKARDELARVCRSGGAIALANWTEEGFIGENFRTVGRHLPAPQGAVSPLLWGDETTAKERLGGVASELRMSRRMARLCYPFPPAQTVEFFKQFYGPTVRAFACLDNAAQAALRNDLEQMFHRHNIGKPGTTEVRAEYLEIIATRK